MCQSRYLNPGNLGLPGSSKAWRGGILGLQLERPLLQLAQNKHSLLTLVSAYHVDSAYEAHGRTAHPSKASQSLARIPSQSHLLYSSVSLTRISLSSVFPLHLVVAIHHPASRPFGCPFLGRQYCTGVKITGYVG